METKAVSIEIFRNNNGDAGIDILYDEPNEENAFTIASMVYELGQGAYAKAFRAAIIKLSTQNAAFTQQILDYLNEFVKDRVIIEPIHVFKSLQKQ